MLFAEDVHRWERGINWCWSDNVVGIRGENKNWSYENSNPMPRYLGKYEVDWNKTNEGSENLLKVKSFIPMAESVCEITHSGSMLLFVVHLKSVDYRVDCYFLSSSNLPSIGVSLTAFFGTGLVLEGQVNLLYDVQYRFIHIESPLL